MNDNGSGAGSGDEAGVVVRDAVYLYNQPLNARGDKILVGENCDVFQLVLDVNAGYTDLAMSESGTLDGALAAPAAYPDRILDSAAMFSYALYTDQPVKIFSFNDRSAPASPGQSGTATVFGYCYSARPNARAYLRERDHCLDRFSDGQTRPIAGCVQ